MWSHKASRAGPRSEGRRTQLGKYSRSAQRMRHRWLPPEVWLSLCAIAALSSCERTPSKSDHVSA